MTRSDPTFFRPDRGRSWTFGPMPGAITGSPADDELFGGKGADHLSGGDGDDVLHSREGDDVLLPGAGSDRVKAGGGNDWVVIDQARPVAGEIKRLSGGRGDDTLDYGQTQAHGVQVNLQTRRVHWGDAVHRVTGFERVYGTDRDDRFEGDASANVWRGGGGRDTYVLTLGGGHDRVEDSVAETAFADDTVELGAGITADQVTLTTEGSLLRIAVQGTGDSLTVPRSDVLGAGVNQLVLAGGQWYSLVGLNADVPMQLSTLPESKAETGDPDDVVEVKNAAVMERFDGGHGTDTLSFAGIQASSHVDLTAGRAVVGGRTYVFANFEKLVASDSDARVDGSSGSDNVVGGKGADRIYGNAGDDRLQGWSRDWLEGGEGDDWFVLAPSEVSEPLAPLEVFGGPGWDTADYSKLGRTDRGIQLQDDDPEWIRLADGVHHHLYDVERFIGTDGRDYFGSNDPRERWFDGGKGNDRYKWLWDKEGNRRIKDFDDTPGNEDILYLPSWAGGNLYMSRDGDHLIIADVQKTRWFQIDDWFKGEAYQIEKIVFHDRIVDYDDEHGNEVEGRQVWQVTVSPELMDSGVSKDHQVPFTQMTSAETLIIPMYPQYVPAL